MSKDKNVKMPIPNKGESKEVKKAKRTRPWPDPPPSQRPSPPPSKPEPKKPPKK